QVKKAITPRTKAILVNSPANPTGHVASEGDLKDLARLAAERNVLLISDEIYRSFCYDRPFVSPASFNDDVLVIDGFSKSHAMTGGGPGSAHGPAALAEQMTNLQQFPFVCPPSMVQSAGLAACDVDVSPYAESYRHKRDLIHGALSEFYEIAQPGGAFYLF